MERDGAGWEKENRQRVTLTKDRWSIEDDRSFCAYASFFLVLEITQLLVQEVDEGRGRGRGRDGGGKSREKVVGSGGTSGSGDRSTSSEGKRKRASRKEAVKLIQTRRYDEINGGERRDRIRRGTRVSCFARSLWASWRGKKRLPVTEHK